MSDGKVHAQFGGSTASRWMNCPGSVALIATLPPEPSSIYAEEGTRAHTLAQHCLENGYRSATAAVGAMTGADLGVMGYSLGMCDAVQVYLDAVWTELDAASDAELFVEQRFTFPNLNGEAYGSNDALVYTASRGRLAVFDYKHGAGVSVTADDNAQLKFYASGALLSHPEWRVNQIELFIVQPRAYDADTLGEVRPWTMDMLEVLNFSADIAEAIALSRADKAPLWVGPWCRWCPAAGAGVCPAKEKAVLDGLGVAFEGVADVDPTELPEPSSLVGERLSKILVGLAGLETWAAQVREYAESQMLAGALEIPGWKVVEKIGRAKYVTSDADIFGYLSLMWSVTEDELMPRSLVGITALRKMLKAAGANGADIGDFEARYTRKESSGLTIAPMTDRRPAVSPGVQFDGVSVEN